MLYLKHIPIQSFSDTTVFIHKDCTVYKVDDIKALTRVEVHGGEKPLYAFLSVVEDENIVSVDEIGVNNEAFFKLGLPEGALVTVLQSEVPQSLDNVAKKSQGYVLNSNEYISIVNDIASGKYLNADIASFVTAFCSFSTVNEVAYLAQALSFGNKLYWDEENIIAGLFAKAQGVHKIIAKVNEDSRAQMVESLGLDSLVSAKTATADAIISYVRARQNSYSNANVETMYRLVDDRVEALEFLIKEDAYYTNIPLKDLPTKPNNLIACIGRDRQIIIPSGNDFFQKGDSVVVITRDKKVQDIRDVLE